VRVAPDAFQWATFMLLITVCTLASAGRKSATANPPGAGAAGAAAGPGPWAWAATQTLTMIKVKRAVVTDWGDWDILSPDDNGEGEVATCGAFDGLGMLQQNKGCSFLCGPVAQLGARFHGMEEVIGSIPIRSTNQFNKLDDES
jgi:hypothetical protein